MSPALKERVWKCKTCSGINNCDESVCEICPGDNRNITSLKPSYTVKRIYPRNSNKQLKTCGIWKTDIRQGKITGRENTSDKRERAEQRPVIRQHFLHNTLADSMSQKQPKVRMNIDSPECPDVNHVSPTRMALDQREADMSTTPADIPCFQWLV